VLNYQLFKNGIINKIENSVIQNQQLAELRNWLLNMLMNGQVTVGDWTHSPCPKSQIQNRRVNKNGSGAGRGNLVYGKVMHKRKSVLNTNLHNACN